MVNDCKYSISNFETVKSTVLIAHEISENSRNNTDIDNESLSLAPDATTAVNGPIIGILTRESSDFVAGKYPMYDSFIAASYVKYKFGII